MVEYSEPGVWELEWEKFVARVGAMLLTITGGIGLWILCNAIGKEEILQISKGIGL
jgi:hypothetical protein